MDPYDIFNVPSDLVADAKWGRLIETNPKRVVGIFDVAPVVGSRNRWGDTHMVKT